VEIPVHIDLMLARLEFNVFGAVVLLFWRNLKSRGHGYPEIEVLVRELGWLPATYFVADRSNLVQIDGYGCVPVAGFAVCGFAAEQHSEAN
jgi:hypothetical protein